MALDLMFKSQERGLEHLPEEEESDGGSEVTGGSVGGRDARPGGDEEGEAHPEGSVRREGGSTESISASELP
jgi:hypothetical protein